MADERVPTANMVEDPSDHSKNPEHPDWNAQHGHGRKPDAKLAEDANFENLYKSARKGESARAAKKTKGH